MVYAYVHDAELEAVLAAEHVDAAAAAGEVDHLLPGHFARTDADPFALYAVVAAQEQVAGVCEAWRECLLDEAYLHGYLLQPSQGAFGLVQVVYLVLYVGLHGAAYGLYVESLHFVVLIFISMPLTMSMTSSACSAMCWFIQPCRSVNLRWTASADTPPRPISFVTKM